MDIRLAAIVFAILLPIAGTARAGEPAHEKDFEKGFYLENGERDLAAALKIYESIIDAHEAGREIVARSWVRKGICLAKLGREIEAREALEKVKREFADQRKAVQEALEALVSIDKQTPLPGGDVKKIGDLLKAKLAISFTGAPMTEAASAISKDACLAIVLDPEKKDWDRVLVTGSFEDLTIAQILTRIADSKCLDWGIVGGKVFVGDPGRPWEAMESRRIAEALEKHVSLDFNDTPIADVFAYIRSACGINVVLDSSAAGDGDSMVQLSVTDIQLKSAIDLLTKFRGLDWCVLHGVVYVAGPEALNARRSLSWFGSGPVQPPMDPASADAAVRRSLSRNVLSVDFLETPLDSVIMFIREVGKLNIVLSPQAREKSAEAMVTLAVNEMPLERVLRLILGQLEFEYSVENGVLVIRTR